MVVFSYSQPSSEISSLRSVIFDLKLGNITVSLFETVLEASVTTSCGVVGLRAAATEDSCSGVGSDNVLPEKVIPTTNTLFLFCSLFPVTLS